MPALDASPALRFGGELADAIRALPRRQAEVVLLHYYGDLTLRDTAARLGVREGTVKAALHDARRHLERSLRDDEPRKRRRQTMVGWHMAGSHPGQYDHEVTDGTAYGKPVARLWFSGREPEGFGTLMQTFSAANYLGRRLRFSGGLKAVDVEGWAGLWMRVDGPRGSEPLSFDNMENRPLKGSRDWHRHEIVLDVPAHARAIALGVLLVGRGEVLMADFGLEPVSHDVPTTGLYERYPDEPRNLDFSETPNAAGG